VQRIRQDGVPVVGFTWYSLLDQLDWDISLREKRLSVNACGLYDLDRKIRPVGESYKMLIREFGQITMMPHGEIFEFTDRPSTLKVEK
jgi:beta-glucosidase/6-phospho-beta-glucosidase/beta-galactosidase